MQIFFNKYLLIQCHKILSSVMFSRRSARKKIVKKNVEWLTNMASHSGLLARWTRSQRPVWEWGTDPEVLASQPTTPPSSEPAKGSADPEIGHDATWVQPPCPPGSRTTFSGPRPQLHRRPPAQLQRRPAPCVVPDSPTWVTLFYYYSADVIETDILIRTFRCVLPLNISTTITVKYLIYCFFLLL